MNSNRTVSAKKIILSIATLILAALFVFSAAKLVSIFTNHPTIDVPSPDSKSIERNGTVYFPKQDVTTFLMIGNDRQGEIVPGKYYSSDTRADVILLAIFDNTNKSYNILNLNRDTMLQIPVIGDGGKEAGTYYGQLALSFTYGTGLEDSCINTRNTVSDFLYGIPINYYAAFNMDAISILNDSVGGVKVNVTDDFSAVDPSIKMGEITLTGDQAYSYVRSRKGVGDQLNISRMNRQNEYMNSFVTAFSEKFTDKASNFIDLYDDLSPYMITDCSATMMSTLASRYCNYEYQEIISPKGENRKGETYMEFYPDEEKLDDLILELLYAPKR